MREDPKIAQYTRLAFSTLTVLFCAAYLTIFCQDILIARRGVSPRNLHLIMLFVALTLLLTGITYLLSRWKRTFSPAIHHWRYVIGALVIALLTLFKISGSSVSAWSSLIGGDGFQGTLWGIPRSIRSDEYVVFTPFAFSQAYTGYSGVSDILRAFPTDVTMLYAQPSWALATLFRPFLWGFMLFGSQHGLAFFWSARLVALLLASYEFGRWLTDDRRLLAAAYALCIGFAPIIQWWFAVNGTAELMIFGQVLVLLFARYLNAPRVRDSWIYGALIAYCCGSYALILYPAWQVALFYVFGALGIAALWQFITDKQNEQTHSVTPSALISRYILPAMVPLGLLAAMMGWILHSSRETISTMMHTAYPGARVETGGGLSGNLFNYMQSLFGALLPEDVFPNVCEQAVFISLFPLGIILAMAYLIKSGGHKDTTLSMLLGVDALLLTFGIFGFPVWLSKATLLSNVTVQRLQMATTLIDVMLLFRALTLISQKQPTAYDRKYGNSRKPSYFRYCVIPIVPACGASALIIIGSKLCSVSHIRRLMIAEMFVAMAFCFLLVIQSILNSSNAASYIIMIAAIITVAGLCINPVQYGTAALTDNETVITVKQQIAATRNTEETILATDSPFLGQAFIANGVPTVTSTNSVPTLERWRKIDPSGKYKTIYNRYAYVEFSIQPSGKPSFELKNRQPDYIVVHLTVNDLKKIGVNYMFTSHKLQSTNNTNVRTIASIDNCRLYRIK